MNTRIKLIRTSLHLSQKEFGERLGVSRDVISNIEYGRVKPKELLIKHICDLYCVNESFIKAGSEPMFNNTSSYNPRLKEAMDIFCSLHPAFQDCALEQIRQLAKLQEK